MFVCWTWGMSDGCRTLMSIFTSALSQFTDQGRMKISDEAKKVAAQFQGVRDSVKIRLRIRHEFAKLAISLGIKIEVNAIHSVRLRRPMRKFSAALRPATSAQKLNRTSLPVPFPHTNATSASTNTNHHNDPTPLSYTLPTHYLANHFDSV